MVSQVLDQCRAILVASMEIGKRDLGFIGVLDWYPQINIVSNTFKIQGDSYVPHDPSHLFKLLPLRRLRVARQWSRPLRYLAAEVELALHLGYGAVEVLHCPFE